MTPTKEITAEDFENLIPDNGNLDYIGRSEVSEAAAKCFELAKLYHEQQKEKGWISVCKRLPTKEDGDKVLIYRTVNESQRSLAYTIYDYSMVRYCDQDTFWQRLPQPPTKKNKI